MALSSIATSAGVRNTTSNSRTELPSKQNPLAARKTKSDRLDSTRPDRVNSIDSAASLSRSSYMCRKCRAHGKRLAVKGHKRNCPFRNCTCAVCSLVNYGRHIVAKQIALYRDQKNHHHFNHSHQQIPHPHHQYSMGLRSAAYQLNNGIRTFLGQPDSLGTADIKRAKDGDLTGRGIRSDKLHNTNDMIEDDGPHCRRCRNHGESNPWKGHKKTCPYRCCICQQCILISLRKSNEKNLSKSYGNALYLT